MFPTISAILCLVLARRALLRNGLTFASYNSRSRRTRRRWARRWAIRWRGTTTLILATNTATFARALFILSSAATFFLDTVSFLAVTRHYSINLGVAVPKVTSEKEISPVRRSLRGVALHTPTPETAVSFFCVSHLYVCDSGLLFCNMLDIGWTIPSLRD